MPPVEACLPACLLVQSSTASVHPMNMVHIMSGSFYTLEGEQFGL